MKTKHNHFIFIVLWPLLLLSQSSVATDSYFQAQIQKADSLNPNNLTITSKKIPLSLNEAISLALKENITVKSAYLSRITDKFAFVIEQNQYRPQYSLSSSVGHYSNYENSVTRRQNKQVQDINAEISLKNPLGGRLSIAAQNAAEYDDDNDFTSGINLNYIQPLLRGGGLQAGRAPLTKAEFSEKLSILNLKNSLIQIVGQVIRTYRRYVLALRSLDIAQRSLRRAQQQLDINKALIAAGRLPSVEQIQSETSLANQELTLKATENEVDAARIDLLQLLRLDVNSQIIPNDPLTIAAFDGQLKKLLATAYENRPDYLSALVNLETAKLDFDLSQNEQLWDLQLSTSYALSGSSKRFSNAWQDSVKISQGDLFIGLNLSIPINDLSRRNIEVLAKSNLIKTENQLIQQKENIRLELVNALRDIEIKWGQVHLSKRSLDLSLKQLELEQVKLQSGRSSNFQVVNFQNQLAAAENHYISSKINYLNSLTSLYEKLGTSLEHWGITIEPKQGLELQDMEKYQLNPARKTLGPIDSKS